MFEIEEIRHRNGTVRYSVVRMLGDGVVERSGALGSLNDGMPSFALRAEAEQQIAIFRWLANRART